MESFASAFIRALGALRTSVPFSREQEGLYSSRFRRGLPLAPYPAREPRRDGVCEQGRQAASGELRRRTEGPSMGTKLRRGVQQSALAAGQALHAGQPLRSAGCSLEQRLRGAGSPEASLPPPRGRVDGRLPTVPSRASPSVWPESSSPLAQTPVRLESGPLHDPMLAS